MIKFFRKIRQSNLKEGKTLNYLKYAIGEIILVVIGILIALQVNNWNTNRVKDKEALMLMSRLLNESSQNKEELKVRIQKIDSLLNSAERFLKLFDVNYTNRNVRTVDSLIYDLLYTPNVKYKSSTLNEALNSGIVSLIQSDSLRDQLYQIPDMYADIVINENLILDDYKNNLMPYIYDNISLRQIDGTIASMRKRIGISNLSYIDNRKILSDVKFESIVDNKMFDLNTLLERYYTFSELNNSNISFLEKEMSKLKKE